MISTVPPERYLSCTIRGEIVDGVVTFGPIDDDAHWPFGVTDVKVLTDRVRVYHDPVLGIGDVQVTADETLGDNDITAHDSAGLSYFDVYFKRSGTRIPPSGACLKNANVWIGAYGYRTAPTPAP